MASLAEEPDIQVIALSRSPQWVIAKYACNPQPCASSVQASPKARWLTSTLQSWQQASAIQTLLEDEAASLPPTSRSTGDETRDIPQHGARLGHLPEKGRMDQATSPKGMCVIPWSLHTVAAVSRTLCR